MPQVGLSFQLFSAATGQLIVFGAAIVVRRAPTRLNPSAAFKPVKSGIQRSLANLKSVARYLLNTFGNRPAVLGLEGDRLENQQV
jgi:hypothetical protein